MKKVIVAGATGLVGREVLHLLAQREGLEVIALVRRLPQESDALGRIDYRLFDYENTEHYAALTQEKPDVIFCCLGTTRKKVRSAEEFVKVDFKYPQNLLNAVVSTNPVFCLVSSVGAGKPHGLYLRTKAQIEAAVRSSGLRHVIMRPALLLGSRSEFRFGESLAALLFAPFKNVLSKSLGEKIAKYAPIHAHEVASAMLIHTLDIPPGNKGRVVEGRAFFVQHSE